MSRASGGWERRKHARRDIVDDQIVPIQLGANNGGLVVDLSTGGAAVVSVAPLERSSTSAFTLQLGEGNAQVEGTGVFVWVDDSGLNAGLRFDRLSRQARMQLDQWLSERTTAPEEDDAAEEQAATEAGAMSEAVSAEAANAAIADRLQRLAERAQLVAQANGACIALKGTEGYRCEASVGIAPEVGSAVNQERGLAFECIAGRHVVVCNDTSRDPRINVAMREHLSFASAILLPLCRGDELTGILGVFSERRDAFGGQTIVRLQDAARLIENSVNEPARGGRRAADNVTPPAQPARVPQEIVRRSALAGSVARVLTISLVATLGLLSLFYVYELRFAAARQKPEVATTQPVVVPEARPAEQTPASTVGKSIAPAPVATPSFQAPAPNASARVSQTSSVEHRTNAAAATGAPVVVADVPAALKTGLSPQPVAPATIPPAPQTKPSLAPTQIPPPATQPQTPAPTPATTSATPQAPHVQVITDVLRPKPGAGPPPEPVSKVEIAYPSGAVAMHRQGAVILKVTVEPGGSVRGIAVLDGDALLAGEAVRAVRQWRYKANGREGGMDLLLTINFMLSD